MELQAVRSLAAYAALISLGVRENTTERQAARGTMSFLNPKGITAIHANGTIRRSWMYEYATVTIYQSPIVRNLPLETEQDWTNALNRVAHQVAYAGPGATKPRSLEEVEADINYGKEGKRINNLYDSKIRRIAPNGKGYNTITGRDAEKQRYADIAKLRQSHRDAQALKKFFVVN